MLTPQQEVPRLAKRLGLEKLYFKREDLHPYKSHKGRSIPIMIETHARGGHTRFAISSSGNAALAAILYIIDYNKKFTERPLSLSVYVGQNILPSKLKVLTELASPIIKIEKVDAPKQAVHILEKRGEAKSLRQSQDPLALVGYNSLVEELSEIPNLGSIFVPTSSGTTAEALASKFSVHVIQPQSCHPIAENFDMRITKDLPDLPILADAIVDKVALRKDSLIEKLKKNNGGGWVINNQEIAQVIKLTKETENIELSPNSALALAGLRRALTKGWQTKRVIACLITGR